MPLAAARDGLYGSGWGEWLTHASCQVKEEGTLLGEVFPAEGEGCVSFLVVDVQLVLWRCDVREVIV